MKRLLRILGRWFSALTLVALVALAAIWLRPVLPPVLQPEEPPPIVGVIDRIVVEKSARRMTLWQDGVQVRDYPVALGFTPEGDKQRQGDGKTPEGIFAINRRNDGSAYHLSLGLDYPQPDDLARARAGGYDAGGDIMIHGQPNALPDGLRLAGDWTAGCIALTNAQMREVWAVTDAKTVVEIRP